MELKVAHIAMDGNVQHCRSEDFGRKYVRKCCCPIEKKSSLQGLGSKSARSNTVRKRHQRGGIYYEKLNLHF